jgi:PmbA protein
MSTIFPHSPQALADITAQLLDRARAAGATDAMASVSESKGIHTHLRQGRIQALSREVRSGVSLTVYIGHRQGSAHSTEVSPESLQEMANAACAIARHTQEDPFSGLADEALLCRAPQALDLFHPWEPDTDTLISLAREIEGGMAAQPEVQSDGVWASAGQGQLWMANSHGFAAGYAESNHTLAASAIATRAGIRTRDFWSSQARRADALQPAASIGAEAAQRSAALLDQGPIGSGHFPVLFDARHAVSFLGHLVQAISGHALYMKTTCLGERFGSLIFPPHLDVIEDPFVPGGHASAPFDSEGVAGTRRALVDQGVLRGALLSTYSARRLGQRSTGNAGGCYNLQLSSRLSAATDDIAAMLRQLGKGLFVTGLSGDGVRLINGDYSRVARGFWVEGGQIVHAVDGVTIAGNLLDMWQQIAAVGADSFTSGALSSGAILVERMRIAGP